MRIPIHQHTFFLGVKYFGIGKVHACMAVRPVMPLCEAYGRTFRRCGRFLVKLIYLFIFMQDRDQGSQVATVFGHTCFENIGGVNRIAIDNGWSICGQGAKELGLLKLPPPRIAILIKTLRSLKKYGEVAFP